MSHIAVAVSGGADSLYALISLQEEGHTVMALHGLFLPEQEESAEQGLAELKALCAQRHIPLHIVDYRDIFDKSVITPFLQEYANGRTPNPCAVCNAHIKFGVLMDSALELGAELFATGHYASLKQDFSSTDINQSPLYKGQDAGKDQSYFLSLVPRERFARVLFPLANTNKKDNVAYLQSKNISIPIPKESQEICFVPPTESSAYRDFVQKEADKRAIHLGTHGKIMVQEQGQEIAVLPKQGGVHAGLWQYTEGQRRGLGVAWKEPLYVLAKNNLRNTLILCNKEQAVLNSCTVKQVNFFVNPKRLKDEKLFVRLRYRQMESPADIVYDGERLHITFPQAQSLTAPGQVAVIYDAKGAVLAGGIIDSIQ